MYLQQQKGKGLTHSIDLDAKIRFLNSFSSYCLSPFHSFCVRGLSPPLAWKFLESRHRVLLCVSCAWPIAQGSRRGSPELSRLTWWSHEAVNLKLKLTKVKNPVPQLHQPQLQCSIAMHCVEVPYWTGQTQNISTKQCSLHSTVVDHRDLPTYPFQGRIVFKSLNDGICSF